MHKLFEILIFEEKRSLLLLPGMVRHGKQKTSRYDDQRSRACRTEHGGSKRAYHLHIPPGLWQHGYVKEILFYLCEFFRIEAPSYIL